MGSSNIVKLDDATLLAVDSLAAELDVTREAIIARAVASLSALNEWQVAKIRRGLEAAERGDFASEAEFERVRAKFASRP